MTSPRKYQLRRVRAEELAIFDGLSPALRAAINNAGTSVRPSTVLNTLLRGVPEAKIIETINKRSLKS